MITNILSQSFSDFAQKAKTIEEKSQGNPQRQRLDVLADYYTNRVSNNETELITKYADALVSGGQPHTPDPRLYMRRDLLGLVQDSYALGIADALVDLRDVQFSNKKTSADFAVSPDDKLQRDIQKLQRDIRASQNIVRQTKTLNQYTNTLQNLQQQAQTLNNIQATQTLNQLSEDLQRLKTDSTVRAATRLVNQQIQKGQNQRQSIISDINQKQREAEADAKAEEYIYSGEKEYYDRTPDTQDYLVKRAIEEKLKYLENRRDSLAATPPVVLDEDKDFFRWYADKRLVPIANRYQQGLQDKNNEAKDIATKYAEEINKGTTTQAAKGTATDKIIRKLLSIENTTTPSPSDKKRPIKRVQRVVATELAIAYNVGRLKAYMKAGIQYVTISTSMYSPSPFPCDYCKDTEEKSQDNPISIASLLKNAYKNRGFDKNLNRPIEQRYLVHHPYCMCFYKPHPKQDPEDKQESAGVYADPNSWKFILGAGLGVSLAFLAFALTTGRKIVPPTTIPIQTPRVNLPITTRQRMPDTIPVDVEPLRTPQIKTVAPDLRDPLSIRSQYQTLLESASQLPLPDLQRKALNFDLLEIIRDPNLDEVGKLMKSELVVAKASTPEYANSVINTVAKQAGLTKELYFGRFDKIARVFNKTVSAQPTIDKLAARVDGYVDNVDGKAIINAANNIEKTKIDKQLQPISLLRSDLSASLQRVSNKVNKKEADLSYIKDLESRIADLDNFATILRRQKTELQNIKASVRVVNKAVVNQQVAVVQSVVDRLATDPLVLQEALDEYQDLLEMLVVLPQKEAVRYTAKRNELNRRIKKAQGIELKRFVGNVVGFSKYSSAFYKYF
jgi:hypothetical protein